MAKFQITSPEGKRFEIEAPDGATEQDVMAYAQKQAQQSMSHQPGPKPAGTADAILAGLNSRADKLADGIVQPFADDHVSRGLKALEADRNTRDAAVKKTNPMGFALGDNLPLMAVPGGQATTAGRIAAPAIGAAAMEGLSYGSTEERLKRAGMGAAEGAAGGGLGELVGRFIKPMRAGSTVPDDVLEAADRLGIKPTAGQSSGSKSLLKMEDALTQTPFAQDVMGRKLGQQRTAMNQAAARSAGMPSDVIDQKYLAAATDAAGVERNALEAAAQVSPVDVDLLVGVRNAQQRLGKMQSGPSSLVNDGPASKIINDFTDFVQNAPGPMDGATYQSWKTLLTDAKKTAFDGKDTGTGKVLGDLLEGLNKAAQKGNEKAWKNSDIKFSTLDILKSGNVVNEATGDVHARTLASKFYGKFGNAAKEGKLPGELQDIALVAKGLPEMREGSQTAGRAMWAGLGGAAAMQFPLTTAAAVGVPTLASRLLTSPMGAQYLTQGLASQNPVLQRILLEQAQRAGTIGGASALSGLSLAGQR